MRRLCGAARRIHLSPLLTLRLLISGLVLVPGILFLTLLLLVFCRWLPKLTLYRLVCACLQVLRAFLCLAHMHSFREDFPKFFRYTAMANDVAASLDRQVRHGRADAHK